MNLFISDKNRYLVITFFAVLLTILFFVGNRNLEFNVKLVIYAIAGFLSLGFFQALGNFALLTLLTPLFVALFKVITAGGNLYKFISILKVTLPVWGYLMAITAPAFFIGFALGFVIRKFSK